jgi:hypothetical protein
VDHGHEVHHFPRRGIGLAVPGWPIRFRVAEDRSAAGVRDRTGPEPAVIVVALVRARSARHREPLVLSGHERSRPGAQESQVTRHPPRRPWMWKQDGAGFKSPTPAAASPPRLLPGLLPTRQEHRGRASPSGRAGSRRRPRLPGTHERIQPWSSQPTRNLYRQQDFTSPDVSDLPHRAAAFRVRLGARGTGLRWSADLRRRALGAMAALRELAGRVL